MTIQFLAFVIDLIVKMMYSVIALIFNVYIIDSRTLNISPGLM